PAGPPRPRWPRWVRPLAALLLAAPAAASAVLLGEDPLVAAAALLVLLQLFTLATARTDRDDFRMAVLAFFQLLAASALSSSLGFAAVFVTFMLLSTWTLLVYHLRQELAAQPPGEPPPARRFFTFPFVASTTLLAAATLVFTAAIFLVLPRVGRGFLQRAAPQPLRLSGFSEVVRLGEVGEVKRDPTVVMRVRAPAPEALVEPIRFWRGAAFDRYDGLTWSRPAGDRRYVGPAADGRFVVAEARPGGRLVRQVVSLEPTNTAVLFGASRPVALAPSPAAPRALPLVFRDSLDGVSGPAAPPVRIEYVVESDLSRPPASALRAAGRRYPAGFERYLTLPPLDPRVARLARAVTAGATTPYDQAIALEQHLRTAYAYSLEVRPSGRQPPLEEFLFETRAGYCEYSATAMAILLRVLGIPSRLVSGFLGGEWNEYGGYYIVRQSDAHTWVEAYFPGEGWVAFDPTPPAGTQPPARSPLSALARYLDALQNRWDRYVVGYSLADQRQAARRVRQETAELAAAVRAALGRAAAAA
ncbi:MAG TPA: DUF3488 and transglutaminase-like domain-containing protein, partial [Thermodesulfobacteriota bacterium]|nr:DUF3488 and transglutaminase-like domain-containing protein [Thermodesulfobacteriota bacterium]